MSTKEKDDQQHIQEHAIRCGISLLASMIAFVSSYIIWSTPLLSDGDLFFQSIKTWPSSKSQSFINQSNDSNLAHFPSEKNYLDDLTTFGLNITDSEPTNRTIGTNSYAFDDVFKLSNSTQSSYNASSSCTTPCPIIFIHIQKTGGGSLKTFLQQNGLWNNKHPKHATASIAKQFYSDEEWNASCKLAFVRNPWSRVLSWYSMWVMGNTARGGGVGQMLKGCNCTAINCTFEHFVSNCTETVHYRQKGIALETRITIPQSEYVLNTRGEVMVDFIGKMENYMSDLELFLRNTCNYKPGMLDNFPHVIHNSHHEDYHQYYNNFTAHLINTWYQSDLMLFNYSWPF